MTNIGSQKDILDTIRRKWKINEIIPITQKGYWQLETDVLDFAHLSDTPQETKRMYFQSIDGRNLIKFKNAQFYMEIIAISSNQLKIELHGIDRETDQDYSMVEFICISLNHFRNSRR